MSDRWNQLKGYPRKEDGRLRYRLRESDGKYRCHYAGQFVLWAFVGPCPDGMECCHNDGNCLNDSATNLRWDTHQANIDDKMRHGLASPDKMVRGENVNTAKITEDDVREIRRIGKPLRQHSERYGITQTMVSFILNRKSWKHVQ